MNFVFFFKQKTAYKMRISDWSSDVCSSDLHLPAHQRQRLQSDRGPSDHHWRRCVGAGAGAGPVGCGRQAGGDADPARTRGWPAPELVSHRSEEHTSELQSLMRISYAVFCLKKKTIT